MGEESRRVTPAGREPHETPEQEVSRLRGEIESSRSRLGAAVTELDRRRHELLDWRLQLRRHGGLIAAVGAGIALAIGSAVALGARRERRRHLPVEKARRVKEAVARLAARPELVGRKTRTTVTNKVLSAAGAAAASFLARRLLRQMAAARGRQPA